MTVTRKQLEERLRTLIEQHGIPGAQVAVLDGDEIVEAAAGVLNRNTQVATTPQSLFLPGSIGKSYTATVVMGLVDEGEIELDAPVVTYLPDFRVADPHVSKWVTVRHLLNHTGGFDGDWFVDTGRGEDCLERYVERCADVQQVFPLGAIWSYCNTGYSVLGRIVEVVTGLVWEEALRQRLLAPLGLTQSVVYPEEALLHAAAAGHTANPERPGELMVVPQWGLYRSCGPMGATIVASAADVVRFAQLHLRRGTAPDGTQLLRPETVERMQVEEAGLFDRVLLGKAYGLGWIVDDWDGVRIVGHDGNSLGQNAFLRMAPEHGFAVCIQSNVDSAFGLARELLSWLFTERLGVGPAEPPQAADGPVDVDVERLAGRYERVGLDLVFRGDGDGRFVVDVLPNGPVRQMAPIEGIPLRPVNERTFLLKLPIADQEIAGTFLNPDDDTAAPTYFHFGGRAHRRVD